MDVPGEPRVLTSGAAGNLTGNLIVNTGIIEAFSDRFGACFLEFRIRGVRWEFRAIGANAGITFFALKEDDYVADPDYNTITALTNVVKSNNSSNPHSSFSYRWRAIDLDNLAYMKLTDSSAQASLQYFSSQDFGTPADEPLWFVRPIVTIEFRGLATNVSF